MYSNRQYPHMYLTFSFAKLCSSDNLPRHVYLDPQDLPKTSFENPEHTKELWEQLAWNMSHFVPEMTIMEKAIAEYKKQSEQTTTHVEIHKTVLRNLVEPKCSPLLDVNALRLLRARYAASYLVDDLSQAIDYSRGLFIASFCFQNRQ